MTHELSIIHGQLKTRTVEVEFKHAMHLVKIAQTHSELLAAKALDDLAFGDHLGISIDELTEIKSHGAVLLLYNSHGKLIGESQVITSPISQHPDLAPNEAYNYGTAILPELQNQGLAQILFKAQEEIALAAGKTKSTLTARVENAQSLRGRFKAGFQIVGYDPNHYGSFESGGARLIMEKDLTREDGAISGATLIQKVAHGEVFAVDENNIDCAIQSEQPFISFPIKNGNEIDHSAHIIIAKVFGSNIYSGVGLLKSSEFGASDDHACLLVLKHK